MSSSSTLARNIFFFPSRSLHLLKRTAGGCRGKYSILFIESRLIGNLIKVHCETHHSLCWALLQNAAFCSRKLIDSRKIKYLNHTGSRHTTTNAACCDVGSLQNQVQSTVFVVSDSVSWSQRDHSPRGRTKTKVP